MSGRGIDRRELFRRGGTAALASAVNGGLPVNPQSIGSALTGSTAISTEADLGLKIASRRIFGTIRMMFRELDEMKGNGISLPMLADKCARMAAGETVEEWDVSVVPSGEKFHIHETRNAEGALRGNVGRLSGQIATLAERGVSLEDLRRNPQLLARAFALNEELDGDRAHEIAEKCRHVVAEIQAAFGAVDSTAINSKISASLEMPQEIFDRMLGERRQRGDQLYQAAMQQRESEMKANDKVNSEPVAADQPKEPARACRLTPAKKAKGGRIIHWVSGGGYAYPVYG